ncbi:ABC transporter permease [Thermomonospora curvata]|uniref:Oligopeptide transport system permease protein OppC n=1 Tax=Thermomonospora curvata (strain ATCC 19995 / DSM 43183 / JCM 3096 / KCTC 9072 / NBRC 15933 / NCIMB 10081 / Henssen B9) TaxID=471852 RepID=D1AAA3_THECD|nr:binding-protein-dependent transport systems inner membrane component [Thermomonospora curvata DSM 43183]PKK13026.1 MAG: ABC transporter permease [Thermomonospora sp. CIF 1]
MTAVPRPLPSRTALWARRVLADRRAVLGLTLLGALVLLAFAGPALSRWEWTDTDFTAIREPPSAEHWFGTTDSGRDVYALTLRGMRRSLLIGFCAAALTTALAALVGITAGYAGGWIDRTLMWGTDLLLVVPAFLVVAMLSPALGATWPLLVAVLAAVMWTITARMVRHMTISLKRREFVLAARYMGVGPVRTVLRHILPHLASLLIIDGTLNVGVAIVAESALAYFGFGVRPPDVSLGTLIADGSGAVTAFPWLFGFAAALLVLTVLAVNLVGEGLRDALDPAAGGGAR